MVGGPEGGVGLEEEGGGDLGTGESMSVSADVRVMMLSWLVVVKLADVHLVFGGSFCGLLLRYFLAFELVLRAASWVSGRGAVKGGGGACSRASRWPAFVSTLFADEVYRTWNTPMMRFVCANFLVFFATPMVVMTCGERMANARAAASRLFFGGACQELSRASRTLA